MGSAAVVGFRPSVHGFHFANRWPSVPAFWLGFGLVRLGLGDAGRGLCGGMAYGVRDRFERHETPPSDAVAPAAGTPLFAEIARRQLDSFDRLVFVPWRFWRAAAGGQAARDRASVTAAWPAIRRDIDAGRLSMVGLVRAGGINPLRLSLGHQVAAYRYDEAPDRVAIGIYDPNHPDDDTVELTLTRGGGGGLMLAQSTAEPVVGLLHLPYVPASGR